MELVLVTIYTDDLPRVAAFYRDVFELRTDHEEDDLVALRAAPNLQLCIHATGEESAVATATLGIFQTDDPVGLRARAEAAGHPASARVIRGVEQLRLTDPEGRAVHVQRS